MSQAGGRRRRRRHHGPHGGHRRLQEVPSLATELPAALKAIVEPARLQAGAMAEAPALPLVVLVNTAGSIAELLTVAELGAVEATAGAEFPEHDMAGLLAPRAAAELAAVPELPAAVAEANLPPVALGQEGRREADRLDRGAEVSDLAPDEPEPPPSAHDVAWWRSRLQQPGMRRAAEVWFRKAGLPLEEPQGRTRTIGDGWVECSRCGRPGPQDGPRLEQGTELCDDCVAELLEHRAASFSTGRRRAPGRPPAWRIVWKQKNTSAEVRPATALED